MAQPDAPARKSFGEKLQSLPRQALYLILILCASVPHFFTVKVPGEPQKSTVDFYNKVMELKEGDTILIQSDWTKSTRGESSGLFEALIKILIRKKVKFAFYSAADTQAPQVAEDAIKRVIALEESDYQSGRDYVRLGYFPNAEGFNQQLAVDLRKAFESKTVGGVPALRTPVLQGKTKIEQIPLLIVVTASKSMDIAIERLSTRTTMLGMVTGVMVPEIRVFYAANQIKGMAGGLKGVYDLEQMMTKDWPDSKTNAGKGMGYYPTLHVVLTLMILAVVAGNVGMLLVRRRGGAR